MNVLDLSIFPSMSRRHSEKLQVYNNTEASLDAIWKTVQDVWSNITSADVNGKVSFNQCISMIINKHMLVGYLHYYHFIVICK